MKIFEFIRSILPSFEKERALDDCRGSYKILTECAIPAYDTAVPALKIIKPKSANIKECIRWYEKKVPGRKGSMIEDIHRKLPLIAKMAQDAEPLVEEFYSKEGIVTSVLTFRKAQLLQFLSAVSFTSKYVLKFLDYYILLETVEIDGDKIIYNQGSVPSKKEMEDVAEGFMKFVECMAVLSIKPEDAIKTINEIPDVVINEETQNTLIATMGQSKMDPLKMGFLPPRLNPLYHLGRAYVEWQDYNYQAMKESVNVVQLRIQVLKRQLDKAPDAKLEKELNYCVERVSKYNYKIAAVEKKYE